MSLTTEWERHVRRLQSRFGFEIVQRRPIAFYEDAHRIEIEQIVAAHRKHKLLIVTSSDFHFYWKPHEVSIGSTHLLGALRGPVSPEDHRKSGGWTGDGPGTGPVVRFDKRLNENTDWWIVDGWARIGYVNWDGMARPNLSIPMMTRPEFDGAYQDQRKRLDEYDYAKILTLKFLAFAPDWVRSFILDPPD